MKRLVLIRHGHALPATPGQSDLERPLSSSGEREVDQVAERLLDSEWQPQRIICSHAPRARMSADILADRLQLPAPLTEEALYLASCAVLQQVITRYGDAFDAIAIVGHNPGLTQLVRDLAAVRLDELPTAAVAGIEFSKNNWPTLREGQLGYFDTPRLWK